MKNALIGGFLSLVGSIWAFAVIFIAGSNMVDGWSTPPGRFMTTVSELGLTVPFIISVLFAAAGILIMILEFFRSEKK